VSRELPNSDQPQFAKSTQPVIATCSFAFFGNDAGICEPGLDDAQTGVADLDELNLLLRPVELELKVVLAVVHHVEGAEVEGAMGEEDGPRLMSSLDTGVQKPENMRLLRRFSAFKGVGREYLDDDAAAVHELVYPVAQLSRNAEKWRTDCVFVGAGE